MSSDDLRRMRERADARGELIYCAVFMALLAALVLAQILVVVLG